MSIISEFLLEDNFHLNEKYPNGFDMKTLKSLDNYDDRLEYVDKYLEKLGEGSSRAVYAVDEKKVLKVATGNNGIGQNEAEFRFGKKQHGSSSNTYQFTGKGYNICSRIYDWDEDYRFLEVERAESFNNDGDEDGQALFCYITGFKEFDDLRYALNRLNWEWGSGATIKQIHTKPEKMYVKNLPWLQELYTFTSKNRYYIPGDFARLSTYGAVMREGKPQIIIVDYGFTPSVEYNYY